MLAFVNTNYLLIEHLDLLKFSYRNPIPSLTASISLNEPIHEVTEEAYE